MAHLALVAGDPSGDQHAAALVAALSRLDPSLTFAGLGGPQMREAGVEILEDLTQTAAIGPFDAAKHVRRFAKARQRFADSLRRHRPDLVILVDFGDFNLPVIAPLAKRAGCRVVYYVSPQLWAWGRFRLRWVRRYVDRMLVLFPFEETFYRRHGVPVTWVGHPLADTVHHATPDRAAFQQELGVNPWRTTVGLLPGSREREVTRMLPLLLKTAARIAWAMPGAQFLIPQAPGLPDARFTAPLQRYPQLDVRIIPDRFQHCLQVLDAAIVTSGTATVEVALAQVPMVVVYRTSWPTYWMAKAVLRVPHIAMVNVLADALVVPEYLQHHATPGAISKAVVALLQDHARAAHMREQLAAVARRLGEPGAVERAARAALEELAQARAMTAPSQA